jgi:ABC-type branched-subunit amino acid transport system permease subunit
LQRTLRWLARGGSVLVAVLFALLWWHQPPSMNQLPPVMLAQLALLTGGVLGLLLGWWRERLGGAIAAIAFVGFLAIEGVVKHRLPLVPQLFVMMLPALLYLVVGSPRRSVAEPSA